MKKNNPNTSDHKELPPYVHEFLRLTRTLDQTVRNKNKGEMEEARYQLQLFYGSLTDEERETIEELTHRQLLGAVIEDGRSRIHRTLVRGLHVPHRLIGASAEPIAKLSEKTVELIALTLGLTVRGLIRGVRSSLRGVLRTAA